MSSNNKIIDLRSDTVTQPSQAMLQTALHAKTGDDVLGEDPSVLELQEYVANMFGKEQGLFVPTGTMANLVALMAHCHGRASEAIIGASSHISLWEAGNAAGLGGIHTRQIVEDAETAQLDQQDICDAYRDDSDDHCAQTQVLCLENSHNMLGGVALPVSYMDHMGRVAKRLGIQLHVDGARICNAAVAQQVDVQTLCASADSISLCLSKGLGAPLGSVLVGESEFIRLAKRARKRCGGGMRQAGVVAAMGLYALENNVDRLARDHERAQRLALELSQHGFVVTRNGKVDTNIVYFELPQDCSVSKKDFADRLLSKHGIKLAGGYSRGGRLFRVVTHLDLSDEDVDQAAKAIVEAVQQ